VNVLVNEGVDHQCKDVYKNFNIITMMIYRFAASTDTPSIEMTVMTEMTMFTENTLLVWLAVREEFIMILTLMCTCGRTKWVAAKNMDHVVSLRERKHLIIIMIVLWMSVWWWEVLMKTQTMGDIAALLMSVKPSVVIAVT
jgi:hypothetical protein